MRQVNDTSPQTTELTHDSHLDDLQRRVGEWGERTFPQSTPATIMAHLGDEITELHDAGTVEQVAEEAADCLLLLLHLAHRHGFSLWEAANVKRIVNESRTWETEPNERGYMRHVEAAHAPATGEGR